MTSYPRKILQVLPTRERWPGGHGTCRWWRKKA